LRDKRGEARDVARLAKAVKALAGKYHAIFIVNDRIEAAIASSADGIHIGQGDIDITLARRLLGRRKMIGLSVSNLTQAVKAMGDHPDYLGVGPVFKTPIKSDIRAKGIELLAKVKKLSTPLFAIGGINLKNIGSIKAAGVKRSAVIRAVCAARDPLREAAALRKALQ
jgi:thiamine-phosphate pyrophosphorylase